MQGLFSLLITLFIDKWYMRWCGMIIVLILISVVYRTEIQSVMELLPGIGEKFRKGK